jgi:S1-C subfamily serine protease
MLYQNDNNIERDEHDMHNQQTLPQQPSAWQQNTYNHVPYPTGSQPSLGQPPQSPPHGQPMQAAAAPLRPARTGRTVLLTLLFAVLFGGLLFGAGWEFGRGTGSAVGILQPGTSPQPTVPAIASNGGNIEAVREAVIAKVQPAVVQVNVTTARGSGIGSGVIVDKRGYIVTNNHVVSGAQSIQVVLSDGRKLDARLTGTDATDDLAVIKINPSNNMTVATIGDSSALRVGQEVLAIGNPLGITQTVTRGIVSALNRTVSEGQGGATIPGAIQTDAAINPGNSGGALVNLQGELIGIPTLTAIDPEFNTPASGVGFAIPANRVKLIVPQIIANGSVQHTGRAALGVQVVPVDANVQAQDNLSVDHGALISGFSTTSAAQQAGLKVGDVIVQIDNTPVNDISSLGDALATKNPGDSVTVKVVRGTQQISVSVKLGELQAAQ